MTYKEWCEYNLDYKTITTYFMDLNIAERFGKAAIVDTVNRAIKYDKNYKSLTELCMTLNHKIWFNYENNKPLAELYDKLWRKVDDFCREHFVGEQLKYFYRVTD